MIWIQFPIFTIILHPSAWAIKRHNCVKVLQMFTSKMAADMPSEMELLTTAKHLFTAAWSSCWLLSWAKKIPAVLQRQWQGLVLRDSGLTKAWMTLRGSDKLKAINTAVLCMACTQTPGKSPNQRRQLRAAKIIVVVKAQGRKLKDQLRLESGRTEGKTKKKSWHSPQSFLLFKLHHEKCELHLLIYFHVVYGINRMRSEPHNSQRSKK